MNKDAAPVHQTGCIHRSLLAKLSIEDGSKWLAPRPAQSDGTIMVGAHPRHRTGSKKRGQNEVDDYEIQSETLAIAGPIRSIHHHCSHRGS